MKRKGIEIPETGTKFVTGEVFTPKWSDAQAALGRIRELGLEEELMPFGTNLRVCIRYRDIANKVIPDILARAEYRKVHTVAPLRVMAVLWVLACYNYKWCGGPYPGTIEKQKLTPIRQPIKKFVCPYCGTEWEPPKNYKNRQPILRAFGKWIRTHNQCHSDNHIELDREVE